ncbi:MAG: multicopper oxidase family protein [Clostridia bacterium]|nr:multicopper oxidase family protein [Clostridia bacterium]
MSNKSLAILFTAAVVVAALAGFTWVYNHQMMMKNTSTTTAHTATHPGSNAHMSGGNKTDTPQLEKGAVNNHDYAKNLIKPKEGQPVKRFALIAKKSNLKIRNGLTIPVWTYNGTVPGAEIRVAQGDFVQVELKNELNDPVTIHWHGYPLLSAMDGVPGLNQDSVRPGETFTYEFSADIPGTYWYHSHQEGAKQVDKGLYGALIVESKNTVKADKDYTLILDEWMEKPSDDMESMEGMEGHGDSSGMNMSGQGGSDPEMMEEEMMSTVYNIYTVNGKSGELIKPLDVKLGDTVRLRFINAGYRSHGIHIPGQDIRVVGTDGQEIYGPGVIKDQIVMIAPGERYDIEFKITSDESFIIDAHDSNKFNDQLRIPVNVQGGKGKIRPEAVKAELDMFDVASYGIAGKGNFTINQKYDIDYNVELNTKTDGNALKYTINGKVFDELPAIRVNTGDTIKLTFDNKSKVDHPMHLHGHFFEILSKNGKPVTGAAISKDTLLVGPGEKYVVAFKADNPGAWVQHCHELHHASAGMMQKVIYENFKSNYTPDPNNRLNKPE